VVRQFDASVLLPRPSALVPARWPVDERPAPGRPARKIRRVSPRLQDLRSALACINWT